MDGLIAYALSKKYVNEKTSRFATGLAWKGTKENVSGLPQFGNQVGDLWHVNEDGNEYAWDGSKWEALGGISSEPFVIPVTYDEDEDVYSTTASAADIIANVNNCELFWVDQNLSFKGISYGVAGTRGAIFFYLVETKPTEVGTMQFIVQVDGSNVQIAFKEATIPINHPANVPRVMMMPSSTTPSINPNWLYVFPKMVSLTPSFSAPTGNSIANEYHFIFKSGTTATTLTLPSSIRKPDGFTVEANHVYEIRILENNMTAQGWAVES